MHADTPELFGIRAGQGYGYAGETNTLFLGKRHLLRRAGADGFSKCAALVLYSSSGEIALSHVVPGLEGAEKIAFNTYENAIVICGTRTQVGHELMHGLGSLGFMGVIESLTVPNQTHSFGVFIDADTSRLATAQRQEPASIEWYDIHS